MRPSSAARRYAEAAFQVAQHTKSTAQWLKDLKAASDLISQPNVALYFKDPNVATDDKLRALPQLFAGAAPQVLNLLRMLATRERMALLPSIYTDFASLERAERGVVEAYVTVARQYSDAERADIARRLSQSTGKHVEVHLSVDPNIIGGIVVRIGDRLIDASVSGRLQRLRHEMAV